MGAFPISSDTSTEFNNIQTFHKAMTTAQGSMTLTQLRSQQIHIPTVFLERLPWFDMKGNPNDSTVCKLVLWIDTAATQLTGVIGALTGLLSFAWDNRYKVAKAV